MTIVTSKHNTGVWVDVIFVQNWDEEETEHEAPAFGDYEAMAEYLSKWDMGDETDEAHTFAPYTAPNYFFDDCGDENRIIRYPWGTGDHAHETTIDGLDYILAINWHMRYASLNRRPITEAPSNKAASNEGARS